MCKKIESQAEIFKAILETVESGKLFETEEPQENEPAKKEDERAQ